LPALETVHQILINAGFLLFSFVDIKKLESIKIGKSVSNRITALIINGTQIRKRRRK
jgi:hypothetical protein